ncbi:MAG: MFS transporter [Actinobacteria bacterium]|nr:MFS transporter [Actinomycetota bacterium]MSY47883.1 MFS transporter [Actinomycetota bacterium]MSZ67733.1 MFS transporter [Actinomycetota bacterium]
MRENSRIAISKSGLTPASPLRRLGRVHALTACGEAAFAIALADSLFLSISPDAARSKVLMFLAISLAPFAVIAPFIGPVIDRVPGGRRITVLMVNLLRCITVVLMVQRINSVALFPLAFISLVLSRTYAVSKTALVPTLVSSDQELVAANGSLGLLAGLLGLGAAVPAGLLQLVDSRLTLVMSAVMFGLAGFVSLQLPRHVATTPKTIDAAEITELHGSGVRHAALSMMLLRGIVGFLFFHVAFWLRDERAGTAWFALALGLSSLATMLANAISPMLRRWISERTMMTVSLTVISVTGVFAGVFGGISAGIILIAVCNGMGSIGRLAFESIIQREAPDANRARTFVKFETINQLVWVSSGLVAVVFTFSGAVGFAIVGVSSAMGLIYFLSADFADPKS